MKLYDYAASYNSYKPRLLLAQLGLAYERVPVDIFAGETLTDEYAALNPARTVPLLLTDDGRALPESGAILVYLAEGTPFLPDARLERAEVVRWLIYEQTDVIPAIGGLRFRLQTGRLQEGEPAAVRRATWAAEVLRLLDDHLASREFLVAGRYTIADLAVYAYSHKAGEAGIDLEPYRSVRAWFERVEQQPEFFEDVEPYPANAVPGAGRSIYD